jgi:phosphoribosyl 1,2-cyclic phosphodiesterase
MRFRTLISSSAGNCLELTSEGMTLLIDCGFRAQRDLDAVLSAIHGEVAMLVSHAHTDHIGKSGLKVLAKRGIPVRAHQSVADQVCRYHDFEGWRQRPAFLPFDTTAFEVGPFQVQAIPVPHAPGVPNFGFVVTCGSGSALRKLVFCTDFHDFEPIAPELIDADFIYVESNHDLELLRLHPNPASRYHLSNPKTGELLADVIWRSRRTPQAVMLGHLSRERNHPTIALETVNEALDRAGVHHEFMLTTAPLYTPSRVVEIE